MPIQARHRGLYPFDWRQLSASVRFQRAGGRRPVIHLGNGLWWDDDAQRWVS